MLWLGGGEGGNLNDCINDVYAQMLRLDTKFDKCVNIGNGWKNGGGTAEFGRSATAVLYQRWHFRQARFGLVILPLFYWNLRIKETILCHSLETCFKGIF